jgi:hypothetical protein
MDATTKQHVRGICHRMGLGFVDFKEDGHVQVMGKEPELLARLKIAFPACVFTDYGVDPIDEIKDAYWAVFLPYG